MFRRIGRKRGVAALSIIAVLALAGGAYAYFTSTGTATTNSVTVGSATTWTVNLGTLTGGPLYPGSGSITIPYTVTNAGSGYQGLTAVNASVASSGSPGVVTQGGIAQPGCLASWFSVVNTAPSPLPQNLAGSATSSAGSAAVTMTNSTTSSQNACQGVKPDITISAS